DVDHAVALDMHAADEHRIGPSEVLGLCWIDVLVDKPDLPTRRQRCRDHQQSLRRHEGAQAAGNVVGVFKRTQGRLVARKYAKDAPGSAAGILSLCSNVAVLPIDDDCVRVGHIPPRNRSAPRARNWARSRERATAYWPCCGRFAAGLKRGSDGNM